MIVDKNMIMLEKAVSGASLRHKAILNNIANTNTPGYKRIDVDFKTSLKTFLDKGIDGKSLKELESVSADIKREENTSLRTDGNNVDIEREMALLAKNSLEYDYYMSLLSRKMRMVKSVINENRR
jgi:flagellar basal-body rod protein FlgB